MGYPDIQRAREGELALQRIVQAHAGERADLRALRRVVDICREVFEAIDDDYCREKVHLVAEYAAELLANDQPRARGAVPGAEFLRQQIRGALELLESRLYSLERMRRSGSMSGQQALARAPFGLAAPR